MGEKAKYLKRLSELGQRSKSRFDGAVQKAELNKYKGKDFVDDLFEQWQDIWELWASAGAAETQTALIYLPASGQNNTAWDSEELEFDNKVNQNYVTNLTKTQLMGPVVNGVPKEIPAAHYEIRLQNVVNNVSSAFTVRVTRTPNLGDVGLYRGLLLNQSILIAEISVVAY